MSGFSGLPVGVDLGTTYTCAAVSDGQTVRVVQLTGTSQTIPSVVAITDNGVLAGEAAERRLVSHPNDTAREFKRRFGDPAPLVLAGKTYTIGDVTSHLLREVLDRVRQAEGTAPSLVGLSHPASWGPFRLDLLREAAAAAGVDDVQLVPEPVAAAFANRDRVQEGSLIAVYDLGGGTFDAAVVRCEGAWEVVGVPEGVERLGGIDFDQAIMVHVDQALDGQVFALDSSDPECRSALMQLRAECQKAKEHLSQDTNVEIPVSLPNLRTSVRLTRNEFEAMVRPRLADSLSVMDRVVASAGATWGDISQVLLVGGSSNIPAVRQLVSEHTDTPVMSATNPHLAIAIGTAAIAEQFRVGAASADPESHSAAPASADVEAASTTTLNELVDEVAPTTSKRLPAMLALAAITVIAVIGAVVMFTGGGGDEVAEVDDDQLVDVATPEVDASLDNEEPTEVALVAEPALATAPETGAAANGSEVTASDEAADTEDEQPAVEAEPVVDAEPVAEAEPVVNVCTPDATDVTSIASVDGSLLIVHAGVLGLELVADVNGCDIDPGSAEPVNGAAEAVYVAASGGTLVFSDDTSGFLLNRTTDRAVECVEFAGPTVMTAEQQAFGLSETGVASIRFKPPSCTTDALFSSDEFVAKHMAATDGVLAFLGTTAAGEPALRQYIRGEKQADALADFGSGDGVASCAGAWCVFDLLENRIIIVGLDGSTSERPGLSTGLANPIDHIISSTEVSDGLMLVVELADGSTQILGYPLSNE